MDAEGISTRQSRISIDPGPSASSTRHDYVYAVAFFRRNKGAGVRVIDDVALGDDALRAARDAVLANGHWRLAQGLLSVSVDVATRHHRLNAFADGALQDESWIQAWLQSDDETNPQIIWACSGPQRAWKVRGGAYAEHTPEAAMDEFARILDEVGLIIAQTVANTGPEPALLTAALWHGIGSEISHEEFAARWNALRAVDPTNRHGHIAALQYKCKKWFGSHDEMYAFANGVVDTAPNDSPLAVTILQAHIEYAMFARDYENWSNKQIEHFYRSKAVNADIDRVTNKWASYLQPAHPFGLHDQSVLLYMLCRAERWEEAKALFDATDQCVFEYPWYYEADDFVTKAHRKALDSH